MTVKIRLKLWMKKLNVYTKKNTGELVENVNIKKVLDIKWVYTRKSDNSCKASLL